MQAELDGAVLQETEGNVVGVELGPLLESRVWTSLQFRVGVCRPQGVGRVN